MRLFKEIFGEYFASWHPTMRWPWQKRHDALRGQILSDTGIMRRRINGRWQYREMTDDDMPQRISGDW